MNKSAKYTKKPLEKIKMVARDATLFFVGGLGYYTLEIIFRGYSHWSMALCGGICMLSIYHINKKMKRQKIVFRALAGAGIITIVEFICGCVVNLALGWRVWDYSHLPMNLMGQICFPFTALWFLLCLPVCCVCGKLCGRAK